MLRQLYMRVRNYEYVLIIFGEASMSEPAYLSPVAQAYFDVGVKGALRDAYNKGYDDALARRPREGRPFGPQPEPTVRGNSGREIPITQANIDLLSRDLSYGVRNRLREHGINYVRDLLEHTEEEIESFYGIGGTAMFHIRFCLRLYGLELKKAVPAQKKR